MQTIGAFDAKTHFAALLKQVEQGEEIIITKHGHPVAKLVAFTSSSNLETKKQVIQRLGELSKDLKLDGLDLKKLRDEGRK